MQAIVEPRRQAMPLADLEADQVGFEVQPVEVHRLRSHALEVGEQRAGNRVSRDAGLQDAGAGEASAARCELTVLEVECSGM